jgi:hypothetical protein
LDIYIKERPRNRCHRVLVRMKFVTKSNHILDRWLSAVLMTMLLLACINAAGQATNIAVLNFSFESPAGPQGTVAGYPDGWVASNLNPWGVYNPASGLYTNVINDVLPAPADGSQVLWIDSYNYVAQSLTNILAANQTYTLSGAIGNRGDGYGIQLPQDYEYVYLLAGGTVIASNTDLPHPTPGSFLPWSISYTAPATGFPTGTLEIRLGQSGAGEVHYDNLALTINQAAPTAVNTSTNPVLADFSFENPAGAQGTVAGYPDGWAAANLNSWGVYNPAPGLYTNEVADTLPAPADGSQVLWINSVNYVATFLTNTLTANQTYTLTGAIGNRSDGYGIQLPTDQEYVYLLAGNTIIASNVNLPHPAPGNFLPWSISYIAPASGVPAGQLQIRLGQIGAGQVHFDNLILSTVGSNTTTQTSSQDTVQSAVVQQPPAAPTTHLTMLPDQTMQLDCVGAPGGNYIILATTNLAPGITWTTLSTNTADTNGLFRYVDSDATNYSSRFYTAKPAN